MNAPLRLEFPRRPRDLRSPHLGEGDPQQTVPHHDVMENVDGVAATSGFATARSESADGARSMWMTFGEMLQRRVVAPVRNAGRNFSMTGSMTTPAPTAPTLFPPDVQQAMVVHQTRQSLISPQHGRRPEEEGSISSVNQEAIMEEVRKQVSLAMQGRDQEVNLLRQRNHELERALSEANTAIRTYGAGETCTSAMARPGGPQGPQQSTW